MNPSSKAVFASVREIFTQEHVAEHLGKDIRTIRRWEKGEAKVPKSAVPALREMLRKPSSSNRVQEDLGAYAAEFTFIDLFAGIGGTRLGFESAGGKCVFTSEWDKYACQTYRANHADHHEIVGDIRQVNEVDIPDHDVLVAGFPCQPFSLAGVSKKNSLGRAHGFDDPTQGTLFFDIKRIIGAKRPRAFLLENVKNLRSHDGGKTFKVIMKTLRDDLGYHVPEPRIIDAGAFVPQHRERIFIAGFREDCDFDWDKLPLPPKAQHPRLSAILHHSGEAAQPPFTIGRKAKTYVSDRYTLSDHLWGYLQAYAEKHKQLGHGFGCSVFNGDGVARTLSARYHKDGSEILIAQDKRNPRRLTPRECARLMGFPESFLIPVSDTQAYRQFGNSVVVPVISQIAKLMSACLRGEQIPYVNTAQMLINDVVSPRLVAAGK